MRRAPPDHVAADLVVLPPDQDLIDMIEMIRQEGLSEEDLIMARYLAFEKGFRPSSDQHAVVLLREAGIPFPVRLNAVAFPDRTDAGSPTAPKRPGTTMMDMISASQPVPDVIDGRAQIIEIQGDMRRRRRRKMIGAVSRLAIFVALPTLLSWGYFYRFATPVYASFSEFTIQSNQGGSGMSQAGAMAGMAGLASGGAQDAIAIQGFLTSRPAFERLDREHGFVAALSAPTVDWLRRIPSDATREEAYQIYLKHVDVGFDPTEGILRLRVLGLDPDTSVTYAKALYGYAAERLEAMTAEMREGQLRSSVTSVSRAEKTVKETRDALVALQEQSSALSSEAETSLVQEQLGALEAELSKDRLTLKEMERNERPNTTRRTVLVDRISSLEDEVRSIRSRISRGENGSLASIQGEIELLKAELGSDQEILTQARVGFEKARADADARARYLALAVEPVRTDDPYFPRVLRHTLMAFCAFLGIYMIGTLTVSILREQITA